MGLLDRAGVLLYLSVGAAAMGTEWEQIIAMARELDHAASAGRGLDLDRIRELARAVLTFQKSLGDAKQPFDAQPPRDP